MPPPDRWLDYSNVGKVIPGTNILCFKVPLKNGLLRQVPPDLWFTPKQLIDHVEKEQHKLKLVIDLTFTTKYYFKDEFTKNGVKYLKIFTEGHVIPHDDVVHRFYDAIETNKAMSEKGDVVGVHCTHGINRTGYMVCRYMIERLAFKPEEAISAFNAARGHDIERENYLADLHTKTFLEGYKNEGRHTLEQKKPNWNDSHKPVEKRYRSERSSSQTKEHGRYDQHAGSHYRDDRSRYNQDLGSSGSQSRGFHSNSYHDNARYDPSNADRYHYGEYTYEIEEGRRDMPSEYSNYHSHHGNSWGHNDGDHNLHLSHGYHIYHDTSWGQDYRGKGDGYRGQGQHYRGQSYDSRGQGQRYGGRYNRDYGTRDHDMGYERQRQDYRGQEYARSPRGNWRNSNSGQQSHHGYNSFSSRDHKGLDLHQSRKASDRPHSGRYTSRYNDQSRHSQDNNSHQERETDRPNTALQGHGHQDTTQQIHGQQDSQFDSSDATLGHGH
ncbi:probable tyrosine-protein phosphatase F54C8.4 [Ylistrum balloti]|uniref:probable tyrosine-protein phosphatase F54C8.4 n=1 Tax=Ylistrum balloti TaxID=509963 RepID=UPI002905DC73|nr:probable tyrosine-protein phosphatase F54C8.4 [Ylistrum balloti]